MSGGRHLPIPSCVAVAHVRRIVLWIAILAFIAPACANRSSLALPASPAPQAAAPPAAVPAVAAPQSPASQTHAASSQTLPSPGFSWSVSGPATVITLVGSIHVGFDGLYPLPGPVESAFRDSTTLAMELALDQEPPERVAELMMAEAMLPKGQTLHSCLSAKTWLRYQAFAKGHVDQAKFFERFRPWFVAQFLSVEKATLDGYDTNKGIDLHFLSQRGSRRLIGVEKAEEQIKLLASLSADIQELMLAEQLDAMDRQDDELAAVVDVWKKGDAEELARVMFADYGSSEYAPVYDALIVQRNIRMTKLIESWLAGKEHIFVVLGAGHFVGKDGIVSQLQRDGWRPIRL